MPSSLQVPRIELPDGEGSTPVWQQVADLVASVVARRGHPRARYGPAVAGPPDGDLGQTGPVRVSARVDYAIRALVHLAAASGESPVKADSIAEAQGIPVRFLLDILGDLRAKHLVRSQRGAEGGYLLGRPADQIALADVIRALEGPLATVHDISLSDAAYPGAAAPLIDVWKAMRVSLRDVFERTSIADVVTGHLPEHVARLARAYDESMNL